MRGFAALILLPICACVSSQAYGVRSAEDRKVALRTCPPPGGPEQAQATLSSWPARFMDAISANETLAYGPTQVIWVHPPDPLTSRCR